LTVSLDDQIACVKRELGYRRHVYPRRVDHNKMTPSQAEREVTRMEAVLATLQGLKNKEEPPACACHAAGPQGRGAPATMTHQILDPTLHELSENEVISKPGLHELPEKTYHADPCPAPSLSHSVAVTLLDQSPRHAWTQHPRLNPKHEEKHSDQFDLGKAVHALALLGGMGVEVIDAKDYKTKAAREAREAARSRAQIPVLVDKLPAVEAMASAFRAQLRASELAGIMDRGRPEQTLIWQEDTKHGPTWCRCRLDWYACDEAGAPIGNVFLEYKTTGASAAPEAFGKTLFGLGYDVQWAFYRRGIQAVLKVADPVFVFAVQETSPPYALSLNTLSGEAQDLADKRTEAAIEQWAWCLANDAWPGYNRRTAHIAPPVWWSIRETEAYHHRAIMAESDLDLLKQLMDWQAPLPEPKEAAE
jgi:hypothetical protein